tara:strand:+ start:662 stop:889 length:228 start_codon:yes stop_codon:yes gene_type:complete
MDLLTLEESMRFRQVVESDGIITTLSLMIRTLEYSDVVKFVQYSLDNGMISSDDYTTIMLQYYNDGGRIYRENET